MADEHGVGDSVHETWEPAGMGRFAQKDPMPSQPISYAYADADPLAEHDPTGQFCVRVTPCYVSKQVTRYTPRKYNTCTIIVPPWSGCPAPILGDGSRRRLLPAERTSGVTRLGHSVTPRPHLFSGGMARDLSPARRTSTRIWASSSSWL